MLRSFTLRERIRCYIKNDFVGNAWHEPSEKLHLGFGVITVTTPSDDTPLQVGERADNTPRMQLFKVSHNALLVIAR